MMDRTAADNPEILAETPTRLAEEELPPRPDEAIRPAGQELVPETPPRLDDHSPPASLEQRVGRLEDALAQLQDTQALEARITHHILNEVQRERGASVGVRESAALVFDAGRQLLPAAVGALHAHAAAVEARARTTPPPQRPSWMIVDLYADLRTLIRMSRDPLYRTIWLSRMILPLVLLAAILTSWLWLNLVPLFAFLPAVAAGLIIKVVDLLLAIVLYKALQREIRRYRETIPDQAPVRHP